MAFCPNCGAAVQGSFCGACGASVTGAPPAGAGPEPGPGPSPAATGAGIQENMAGALCYLAGLITGILFLVLEPYNRNRNIRFHAFQSIFLNVGVIALAIALPILMMIPVFGWIIAAGSIVIWLGFLVLWIVLMVRTYNGAKMVLPVIGPLAEKQAG